MIRTCVLLIALACAGCAPMMYQQPEAVVTTPFVLAEHAAFEGSGDASLSGQGFLRQQGGGVVTCAGSEVFLFPNTAYFQEMTRLAASGYRVPAMHPDAQRLARRTACNAQGNFEFKGVPAENWFVATNVTWTVGYAQQGGALMRRVTLQSGANEVLLSDGDFVSR